MFLPCQYEGLHMVFGYLERAVLLKIWQFFAIAIAIAIAHVQAKHLKNCTAINLSLNNALFGNLCH